MNPEVKTGLILILIGFILFFVVNVVCFSAYNIASVPMETSAALGQFKNTNYGFMTSQFATRKVAWSIFKAVGNTVALMFVALGTTKVIKNT